MITLAREWEDAIKAEGEKTYPNECCGVLLGRLSDLGDKAVEGIIPINNAREAEERYHRFQIAAEDLMRAEREARKRRQDVLGFYHSHPDHPALPSDFDREQALPFYSYIIIPVERGRAGDFTSWELAADRSRFDPEAVVLAETFI
jgi:proteasome lid subunit RPN8/RPN11